MVVELNKADNLMGMLSAMTGALWSSRPCLRTALLHLLHPGGPKVSGS